SLALDTAPGGAARSAASMRSMTRANPSAQPRVRAQAQQLDEALTSPVSVESIQDAVRTFETRERLPATAKDGANTGPDRRSSDAETADPRPDDQKPGLAVEKKKNRGMQPHIMASREQLWAAKAPSEQIGSRKRCPSQSKAAIQVSGTREVFQTP